MVRSKLRNKENWKKYKQQRNKCLSILKGTKTNYFNNLNPKVVTDNKKFWSAMKSLITDNKKFWSAVKSLCSEKSKAMNTIVLYEKAKTIKSYKKVSEVLNKYFANMTKFYKLIKCTSRKSFLNTSIKKIKQTYPKQGTFSFHKIRETETLEIIKSLPKNIAAVFKNVPMRIIKNAAHVYSHRLTMIFSNCIRNGKFPDTLKYPDITLVF